MKKHLVIALICLFLLASIPQPQESSWYAIAASQPVWMYRETWLELQASHFWSKFEGITALQGNIFTPSISNLIHITGACILKRPPDSVFAARILAGATLYNLGTTTGDTLVISFTFPAEPLTISLYQDSSYGVNPVFCNLLFEKVR